MFERIKNFLKKAIRQDQWANPIANINTPSSRIGNTNFYGNNTIPPEELAAMYNNSIARRIVDAPVEDAIKGGIEADQDLLDELNRIKAKQRIKDAGCTGRLYGGALLVAFLDDGMDPEEPVDFKRINGFVSLRVFDRHRVTWTPEDLSSNYMKEHYGEPEVYTISGYQYGGDDSAFFRVHRSRCFMFGGDKTYGIFAQYNQCWDNSVLQVCSEALKYYGIICSAAAELASGWNQDLFKLSGLDEAMRSDQDEAIFKRIQLINSSRSVGNSIFLDANGQEEYDKKGTSAGGLDSLWDKSSEHLCALGGAPATKLFGRSPAGMNSTGENDMRNWYDTVRAYRADYIEPCYIWVIALLKAQKSWKNKPKNFEWKFKPLHVPHPMERAKIDEINAKIAMDWISTGAISAEAMFRHVYREGEITAKLDIDAIYELEKSLSPSIDMSPDNVELPVFSMPNKERVNGEQSEKTHQILTELYNKTANTPEA